MLFALLLLSTIPRTGKTVAPLTDTTFHVPAHEYRYIPARVAHWPAAFECSFEVTSGGPVRVELLPGNELANFFRGREHFLISLGERKKGEFSQAVPEKGEYDIALIDDSDAASEVHIRAAVEFAPEPDVAVYLSSEKQFVVIALSLTFFLLIVAVSAISLARAMRAAKAVN